MTIVLCHTWIRLLVLPLLAFGAADSLAAEQTLPQATAPGIRYQQQVYSDVTVDRDIAYKQTTDFAGQKITLQLDVYRPKADSLTTRPAILWVHGGGLSMGAKDSPGSIEQRYAEAFARRGYVTLSIDYRLRPNPEPTFNDAMRDAMTDVQSALAWLQANAGKYGVDTKRIILAGYSAGAEIVTNLCYTDFVKDMDRHQVFAVVDIAGNTLFFGEPFADSPPCLIVHGTADTINEFSASENLKGRLEAKGIACELFPVRDADHFFNRDEQNIATTEQHIADYLYGRLASKAEAK